ncbi:MAG: cyclic nucleotide-binding domain-containing protein [Candidatus Rokubacteria bacterium]|nr:cyclic nucleotide-binding domain-containing protein [Candidatus Rokubacteria bacterium]
MARHLFIVDHRRSDLYEALKRNLSSVEGVDVLPDRRRRRRRGHADLGNGERRSRKIDAELAALGFAVVSAAGDAGARTGARAEPTGGLAAHDTVAFLGEVRLFKEFTLPELLALAGRLRERTLRAGEVLFREGDEGQEMFLVRRGTILISKAVTGGVDEVHARMGPGDFFGEMSPFGDLPRSATAQPETDAVLLVLDRKTLLHLVAMSPRGAIAFFTAMVREFIERLRRTNDLVAEVTRWGLEATRGDVKAD